jgi:hypothetical protein
MEMRGIMGLTAYGQAHRRIGPVKYASRQFDRIVGIFGQGGFQPFDWKSHGLSLIDQKGSRRVRLTHGFKRRVTKTRLGGQKEVWSFLGTSESLIASSLSRLPGFQIKKQPGIRIMSPYLPRISPSFANAKKVN